MEKCIPIADAFDSTKCKRACLLQQKGTARKENSYRAENVFFCLFPFVGIFRYNEVRARLAHVLRNDVAHTNGIRYAKIFDFP